MVSLIKKLSLSEKPEFVTDEYKLNIDKMQIPTITRYRLLDVSTSIPSRDPNIRYGSEGLSTRVLRDVKKRDRVKCSTKDCHIYIHTGDGSIYLFKWMTEKEFFHERNMYVTLRDVKDCKAIFSHDFYEVQTYSGNIGHYLKSPDENKVKLTALRYKKPNCKVDMPDYKTLARAISTLHLKHIIVGHLSDENLILCGNRFYFKSLEHFIHFHLSDRMLDAKRKLMNKANNSEFILHDLNKSEKFMAAMSMGESKLVVRYVNEYYKDKYAGPFITRFLNLMEFDPTNYNMLVLMLYFDWVLLAMYVTKLEKELFSLDEYQDKKVKGITSSIINQNNFTKKMELICDHFYTIYKKTNQADSKIEKQKRYYEFMDQVELHLQEIYECKKVKELQKQLKDNNKDTRKTVLKWGKWYEKKKNYTLKF